MSTDKVADRVLGAYDAIKLSGSPKEQHQIYLEV